MRSDKQLKEEIKKMADQNLKAYDKLWNENQDRKEENDKLKAELRLAYDRLNALSMTNQIKE